MLKKALLTTGLCMLALLVIVSVMSSNQARREHKKQEAIREFDRKNAEEAAASRSRVVSEGDREKQAQKEQDVDQAIANLHSFDRDVLNEAIQKIQYYKACRAVPELMELLLHSSDDYIAGISAQTIALCQDPATYDTIVEQFLSRNATLSMINAIGEIKPSDERVMEKINKLATEPNQDQDVPRFALRVKYQLEENRNQGH